MEDQNGHISPRRAIGFGAGVVVIVALVGIQQAALRDLREVERSYIAGRKTTACAIAQLNPNAEEEELARLDQTLARIIADAGTAAAQVQERYQGVDVLPLPQAQKAQRAVGRSLDNQVLLYREMTVQQEGLQRQIEALGRSNNEAERALQNFRSVVFVGAPPAWRDRFNCPDPSSG